MPLPNRDIASAFIEFYITERKQLWNLDTSEKHDDFTKTLPEIPAHKLSQAIEILKLIKTAVTLDDWLNLLDELYKKEKSEEKIYNNRYLIEKWIADYPLIGDTFHAIRTFIISEIKNEPQFITLKEVSTQEKINLEKDIPWDKEHKVLASVIDEKQKQLNAVKNKLETRNDTDEYYKTYFKEKIYSRDELAKNLDEKTFDDFIKNVIDKNRKLTICERLLNEPLQTINAQPIVTSMVEVPLTNDPVKITNNTANNKNSETKPSAYIEYSLFPEKEYKRRPTTNRYTSHPYELRNNNRS